MARMPSVPSGQPCRTCAGEGLVPADTGPLPCPDCGGDGRLPGHDVLLEWRVSEIERLRGAREDEVGRDVRWLAFELRRARAALTTLLTIADDLGDGPAAQNLRFVANQALGLYPITTDPERGPGSR
jgi:hypothetical protein